MNTAWLRLAYAFEFLLATAAVFTLWSQIGGQGHLDMMAWYIKLVLGVGMSVAIVKMTIAAAERERAWNPASLVWLAIILALAAAMAAVTIYYHVNESNEEQDEEGTTAAMAWADPLLMNAGITQLQPGVKPTALLQTLPATPRLRRRGGG